MKKVASIVLILLLSFSAFSQKNGRGAQVEEKTRILFVFDASQSMFGHWKYQQKIFAARNILSNFLDSLSTIDNLEVALRVFGDQFHVPPQVCEDSRLLVPFSKDNYAQIEKALRDIVPKGTTPITYALEQAGNDFPDDPKSRNIIILITDGIEECKGDPCEVSLALQKKGIIIKPFVIGIGFDFKQTFDCVGTYIQAKTEKDFISALDVVISQAMNKSTVQVNLLDANNKPTTTNVTVSIYDMQTDLLVENFVHTLNGFGVPDTIYLDPRSIYKVVAHTIPQVTIDSVIIEVGRHNTIAMAAPVGNLSLGILSRNPLNYGLQAIIRKASDTKTLNVQQFHQTETYLTGYYQVEVLSLPRLIIDSVLISQSHTTKVEIPGRGILRLNKSGLGFGSLFKETENGLEWVYRFRDDKGDSEMLYLLPGEYRVTFRSKFSNSTESSIEKRFKIKTGETVTVNIKKK